MTSAPPRFFIRRRPEDFVVVEEPLYPPSGEGGHLFVEVEKCARTTEQIARLLARGCGVSPIDVGYAGRKDRHAVTRQWFSLHGNRFELAVYSDAPCDLPALSARAAELVRRGMPNRYGEQRFGRSGDNAEAARKLFGGRIRSRDLRAARFLVSALQAEVFNALLEQRRERHDEVLLGDLARVELSGGLFWVDDLERDSARARDFEISATGPIFGTKVRAPRGEVAKLEAEVLERHGIPGEGELRLPRGIRAQGTRRPLRVRPRDLELTSLEGADGFRLRCGLPPGAYVTVLVECLIGAVVDSARASVSHDEDLEASVSSADAS